MARLTENEELRREQACKPNFVSRQRRAAIIHLVPTLLSGSSDLPESNLPSRALSIAAVCDRPAGIRLRSRIAATDYERQNDIAGRAAPPLPFGLSPCGVYHAPDIAIGAVRSYFKYRLGDTAPFHPYPVLNRTGRYIFCGTFRV